MAPARAFLSQPIKNPDRRFCATFDPQGKKSANHG